MRARDFYHDVVKSALIADGWTITHDPFVLKWGTKDLFVDLGAERLLAADKAGQKIAVEVKSFSGASEINDLEKALGQFILYHDVLGESEPHRRLYLAIARPTTTSRSIFRRCSTSAVKKGYTSRYRLFQAARPAVETRRHLMGRRPAPRARSPLASDPSHHNIPPQQSSPVDDPFNPD